jgi:hypothetical protein
MEVSSTSYAASAVYGRSASGPFSWQKEELNAAVVANDTSETRFVGVKAEPC